MNPELAVIPLPFCEHWERIRDANLNPPARWCPWCGISVFNVDGELRERDSSKSPLEGFDDNDLFRDEPPL